MPSKHGHILLPAFDPDAVLRNCFLAKCLDSGRARRDNDCNGYGSGITPLRPQRQISRYAACDTVFGPNLDVLQSGRVPCLPRPGGMATCVRVKSTCRRNRRIPVGAVWHSHGPLVASGRERLFLGTHPCVGLRVFSSGRALLRRCDLSSPCPLIAITECLR